MTREEAIARAEKASTSMDDFGKAIVKVLEALDLLKLDEPKSMKQRFCDACIGIGGRATQQIWDNLNSAGLKIVEK